MTKNNLTKGVQKLLKKIAEDLPTVFYTVLETQTWKGADLKLTPISTPDGSPMEDDKDYLINAPMYVASNHYRRMKRIFLKQGVPGVKAYVVSIHELAEKQKESQ